MTIFYFRFTVMSHHLPHNAYHLLNFYEFLENLDLLMANFNIPGTWLLTQKAKSPFRIRGIIVSSCSIIEENF